jgi:outer membrane protein assembly factor BamB
VVRPPATDVGCQMETKTVRAKSLVNDIRSGLGRRDLMDKYQVSDKELVFLLKQLVQSKLMDVDEITSMLSAKGGLPQPVFECPECGATSAEDLDQCPQCGAIVATVEPEVEEQPSPAGSPSADEEAEALDVGTAPQHEESRVVAMFRANCQRTGWFDAVGVRQISELKWKFPTQGWVSSSPAVAYGMVFFGSWDGTLYALKVAAGDQMWKYATGGPMSCSAAVADSKVFMGASDGNFYAFDAETGKPKWMVKTEGPVTSSAAIFQQTVYFGGSDGTLATAGGIVYLTSWDGNMYALDLETGQEKWRVESGSKITCSPAVGYGKVYFGNGDGKFFAMDMKTGQENWRGQIAGPVSSSPALAYFSVYFGSGDRSLHVMDCNSGKEKWSFQTEGAVNSSPVLYDDVVYFGSDDGNVYALA